MYEFCYNYVKAKHVEKTKLCYVDTSIKGDDIYNTKILK